MTGGRTLPLIDPTTFAEWIPPHSIEWYEQLSHLQGRYTYPWNSTFSKPNGESTFDQEVIKLIANKKVLDVGCGHGDFTIHCSAVAKEIVGFDVTDHFIQFGLENKKANVSFVIGNIKNGLPFKIDEFDCAYIRKGPTTAYLFLKNVIKRGGEVIGLHPGDESGKELPILFPNLFQLSEGTSIKDSIKERLSASNFSSANIEVMNSIEYIKSPLDVIKLRCFGQKPTIYQLLVEKNLNKITKLFNQNATKDGLPITFSRYLVRAKV